MVDADNFVVILVRGRLCPVEVYLTLQRALKSDENEGTGPTAALVSGFTLG